MKTLALVLAAAVAAPLVSTALLGQGMPPEVRDNIHTLFDRHDAIRRQVTVTDSGYVSVTETEDARLAGVLRAHVAQMESRLKEGWMVRRWDPAFPEYIEHYRDMDVKIDPTEKGLRVTVTGRTPEAVKVARNHARVIDDFVAHGWQAHDRSHPAVLADGAGSPGGRGRGGPGRGRGGGHGAGHGGHGPAHGAKPAPAHPEPASAPGSAEACREGKACCAVKPVPASAPARPATLAPRGPELRRR